MASYIADDIPGDILELMDPRARMMNSCRGPVQRRLAARAPRGKSPPGIAALIRRRMPTDVLAQQEGSPGTTGWRSPHRSASAASRRSSKGWIDRVRTLDGAFGLTSAGRYGDISGRSRCRTHRRAPIMTPALVGHNACDGIRDATGTITDDWAFRSPRQRRRRARPRPRRDIRHPGPGPAGLPAGLPARPRLRTTRQGRPASHPGHLIIPGRDARPDRCPPGEEREPGGQARMPAG